MVVEKKVAIIVHLKKRGSSAEKRAADLAKASMQILPNLLAFPSLQKTGPPGKIWRNPC